MPDGKPIKIAIIDDDEDDFLLISDFIKEIEGREFEIDWFRDHKAAFERLRNRTHDMYFVDYFLGPVTGLELLKEAAALKIDRPIVLLTGFGNKDVDIQAMKSGATDYLIKSELTSEKLERCIRYSMERIKFVEELKTRETRYRKLFEGSKDAVFIADTSLRFIEVNHSTDALLGSKGTTLNNKTLYDFLDDDVVVARIRDLVKSAGKIDDLEIHLKNGSTDYNCLLSLYVLEDDIDPRVHGIIHDITSLRKAELAKLQTEKLEANERLVRMLAHEIRNPLNNILLSVEHLIPECEDLGQKDFLHIIERNSKRINQIISELLSLASPTELNFEPQSLKDILEQSLEAASDRILLNKINVEKKFPDNNIIFPADKNKLVIAFTNIVINAIEAMDEGGVLKIMVETTPDYHQVSIKDNGRGIPKEYMSKLFEPFFTLKKNGMGLGLTASFSIIQSHKASVYVNSSEGEGSTFVIQFNKS